MVWIVIGAAIGARSKNVPGAENAITIFGVILLAYVWLMYFHLKRQQAKRRRREERDD
ncbi:MAG: hypothetical protein ACJ8ER_13775 [Allosphingosinicella sp.]